MLWLIHMSVRDSSTCEFVTHPYVWPGTYDLLRLANAMTHSYVSSWLIHMSVRDSSICVAWHIRLVAPSKCYDSFICQFVTHPYVWPDTYDLLRLANAMTHSYASSWLIHMSVRDSSICVAWHIRLVAPSKCCKPSPLHSWSHIWMSHTLGACHTYVSGHTYGWVTNWHMNESYI